MQNVIKGLIPHFEKNKLDFLIIGATARDLISEKAKLKLSSRKTTDVDLGILVNSWQELDVLRESFKTNPNIKLSKEENNKVRHYYQGTPFDIVPFGGVEKNGKIQWPPFYDTIMTVTGYKEALISAIDYDFDGKVVKVITPEMLVALKIIAWNDNPTRNKDAQDINFLMSSYEDIDKEIYECLLDSYEEILENFDYDSALAAIALMGFRIKKFSSDSLVSQIKEVFDNREKKERFSRNMIKENTIYPEEETAIAVLKLNALMYGLIYTKHQQQ